jgi:hypothetical protein
MKSLELKNIKHPYKVGNRCEHFTPNIVDDTYFTENGNIIGFYKTNLKGKLRKLLDLIDIEFRSKNVPKSLLERSDVFSAVYKEGLTRKQAKATQTIQMSTILGSIMAKPHMKRFFPRRSAVHQEAKSKNYIKGMLMACLEGEKIIKKLMPEAYKEQKRLIDKVPSKWRFANLFTGSISNYNISAPFHLDRGNIKGALNMIFTKRLNSKGGHLHIPDYNATIEMSDNSLCVYPAWRNIHGVTPIYLDDDRSFRNTHIFYAVKGFEKYE